MKLLKNLLAGCVLLFAANASASVILSAEPGFTEAVSGDIVTIDIVISGLTAGGPDSLGAFDLDILYDQAVLSVSSYSLGNLLGDFALFEADDFSFGDLGGLIDLAVVSYLLDFELDALQPASFILASIDFSVDALAVGSSTEVSISTAPSPFGPIVGDAFGNELLLTSTNSAIISNGVQVSEPGVLALLALPLLILFRRKASR